MGVGGKWRFPARLRLLTRSRRTFTYRGNAPVDEETMARLRAEHEPGELRAVVPIVRTIDCAYGRLTFASLDLRTRSMQLHIEITVALGRSLLSRRGLINRRPSLPSVDLDVTDDLGTTYRTLPGGGGGGPDHYEIRVRIRPEPPQEARQLLVHIRSIATVTFGPEPERSEVLPVGETVEVPLP